MSSDLLCSLMETSCDEYDITQMVDCEFIYNSSYATVYTYVSFSKNCSRET